jgi:hypothetical protein
MPKHPDDEAMPYILLLNGLQTCGRIRQFSRQEIWSNFATPQGEGKRFIYNNQILRLEQFCNKKLRHLLQV